MFKSALVFFISFSFLFASVPGALAAGSSSATKITSKQAAKKSAKKHVVSSKRHSTSHRSARRQRTQSSAENRGRLIKKVVVVKGRRQVVYQRVAYTPQPLVPSAGDLAGLNLTRDPLDLKSSVAYIVDQNNAEVLFEKNANVVLPIASITKLMTSLVVVEAGQDMNEVLEITVDDIDNEKHTSSRLHIGARLTRGTMLHIALMSSENRAASALGRAYPGGLPGLLVAMNAKAKALGMNGTHYVDANGLSSRNVATARDLAKLVVAAYQHPVLCMYSTDTQYMVDTGSHSLQYKNTNHLVTSPGWEIGLQKTGYISEAGRCLVMQANIDGRPVVMVFLDSKGKQSRLADAGRVRKWLEDNKPEVVVRPKPVAIQS